MTADAFSSKDYDYLFKSICDHFDLKIESFAIQDTITGPATRAILVVPLVAKSYCIDCAPAKNTISYSVWGWHSVESREDGQPYLVVS